MLCSTEVSHSQYKSNIESVCIKNKLHFLEYDPVIPVLVTTTIKIRFNNLSKLER